MPDHEKKLAPICLPRRNGTTVLGLRDIRTLVEVCMLPNFGMSI